MSISRYTNRSTKSGFIALITILIVVAVSLIIGTTIIFKSIAQANMAYSEIQSSQAWSAANGCVEYALSQLGATTTAWTSYTGSESLNVGSSTCYILAVTATTSTAYADSRLVKATSTVSGYVRKLQVIVATNTPAVSVLEWQDVGDF